MTPGVLVVMGVSGSGKSTIGPPLALRLGWAFKEGDDLHPAANIAMMARGEPLTDEDREPWLAAVCAWIDGWIRARVRGVLTCSALKKAYRRRLMDGRSQLAFVFLSGDQATLAGRIARRRGHFMPPRLLASQLAALEAPTPDEPVIAVDIRQPVEAQVEAVARAIQSSIKGRATRGESDTCRWK